MTEFNNDQNRDENKSPEKKANTPTPVNFVNIPAELKSNASFCVWKRELRGGSITKVPYNPITGAPAKSNDPKTFTDFTTAMKAYAMGGYAGIGFRVSEGIGAIDIDHCIREDGGMNDVAATVLSMFPTSYFERSPSGTGLRGFFNLSPDFVYDKTVYYINNRALGLEVYLPGTTNRFVTVTGDMFKSGTVERNDDRLYLRCLRQTIYSLNVMAISSGFLLLLSFHLPILQMVALKQRMVSLCLLKAMKSCCLTFEEEKIMGVKISELPITSFANSDDSLILNQGSVTNQITVESLMQSCLNEILDEQFSGFITSSELGDYLSDYMTSSELSNYLSEYLTSSELSGYLDEYLTSSELGDYLSEYLTSADLENYLSEHLTDCVTSSYVDEKLSEYMNGSELENYINEQLTDCVTSSYLDEMLSGYVTSDDLSSALSYYLSEADISPYLSEGLASLSDVLRSSDFASAMSNYLLENGGEAIYSAISQYINPQV